MALTVNGLTFSTWTEGVVTRDLREISGSFELQLLDRARASMALPSGGDPGPFFAALKCGQPCSVTLNGTTALVGWIDDVDLDWSATTMSARIAGRDKVGDLVDCAAAPYGPAEFKGVDLLAIATAICKPFGIPVRAETDVGAPFERLAVGPHEKAMPLLEKAARQRSVLIVSDGVGGLLLTRGGLTRGPGALRVGDNAQLVQTRQSWRERFSDVFVKGQTEKANGGRIGLKPAMDHTAVPLTAGATSVSTPAVNQQREARGILMTGHAVDPEITRWRPTVWLTRSQSGMSTAQEQAEWRVRVARGEGDQLQYSVLDYAVGGTLWRPNQRVAVFDPYTDIDRDMLIAGCTYRLGREGALTRMRVVGVTAYDRINESERRRHPHPKHRVTATGSDSTAIPLAP